MEVIFKKTIKGVNDNADYSYADENYAFVIDGEEDISSKIKFNASWYITNFAKIFNNTIDDDLKSSLKNTIISIRKLLKNNAISNYYELPSASFSFVREFEEYYEICQIGDLPIIILNNDNTFAFLDGDKNLISERNSLLKKVDEYALNMKKRDALELIKEKELIGFKNNRGKTYNILDIDTNVLDKIKIKKIKKDNIKKIILMSSGFKEIYSIFKKYSKSQFIAMLDEGKFNDLFMELKQMQMSDISLEHTRVSLAKDASVIVVK